MARDTEIAALNARCAALEAAVLALLDRVQHLEAEAADRRLAAAVRDMIGRRVA